MFLVSLIQEKFVRTCRTYFLVATSIPAIFFVNLLSEGNLKQYRTEVHLRKTSKMKTPIHTSLSIGRLMPNDEKDTDFELVEKDGQ